MPSFFEPTVDQQLRLAEAIFHQTQPVMVTDARAHILRVNEAFCRLMGYRSEEVLGKTPRLFRSEHHDQAFYDAMFATIKRSGHWAGEIWDRRKSGEVFPKWMSITAVKNAAGEVTHMVACYTDLREQQLAKERIRQLALHDLLTGLPNRALLQERLQQLASEAEQGFSQHGLLLFDLDGFKAVNTRQGFPAGDALLKAVADRLQGDLPETATLARLGNDEFGLLLPHLGDSPERAAVRLEKWGCRLLELLAAGVELPAGPAPVSASIGLTLFAAADGEANLLLQQAEMAMHQAKSAGGGRQHFFDSRLAHAIAERAALEQELADGIGAGELVLHYQPQVRVQDGLAQVTGAEALVRWQHPARGLLGPGRFIALAEESGLIVALGDWVLEAACRQLAGWKADPALADLTLAVNVSAAQFVQDGFADTVLSLIERSGAPANRLKLELTETLLVERPQAVIATMERLKAHGLRFSLDDFGTGYSSLAYLKQLPLHQLKIDQSFVRDMEADASDVAIARSVTELARSLDLAVIAEGVESAGQCELLAGIGCHDYQGYYYSRPLAAGDYEAYVKQSQAASA